MGNADVVVEMLRKHSHDHKNDVIIGKMRGLAGNVFKGYNVPEFDYKAELETLGNVLSDSGNYSKASQLINSTVKLTGCKEVDIPVIIGAFALALGNPIDVKDVNGEVVVYQFIPDDFASKSGISGACESGLGGWIPLKISNDHSSLKVKSAIHKPVKLKRQSMSDREVLASGTEGIKTTAKRMVDMSRKYMEDEKFAEDIERLSGWAKQIIEKNKVGNDHTKYMGVIAGVLTNPRIIRYEKDPLCFKSDEVSGKTGLASKEWLVAPGRTIFDHGVADCDDFALCISAMANIAGLSNSFRIAKCDGGKRNNYTHVFNVLHYPDGQVDGLSGTNEVICDVVYMKRLLNGSNFLSGYGREPKNYGYLDYLVN